MLVGFLVNPIAGIGGRVGLKGSDNVVDEARRRGAKIVSPARAKEALTAMVTALGSSIDKIRFLTCEHVMGEQELLDAGVPQRLVKVVYHPPSTTTARDTEEATTEFIEMNVELILFCGGDGTARDILKVAGEEIPMVGIPAGVKMHSGIFCTRPETLAELIKGFLEGRIGTGEADIMDLDEEAYRRGKWSVRLFGSATTLREPNLIQAGKMMVQEVADEAIKDEMAEHIAELWKKEPDVLFIFGPGSTTSHIAKKLGIDKTLLGIDAFRHGVLIGKDLNEKGLLSLLKQNRDARLIISPIGAQGFILGRGNLQLSPRVIRQIGLQNIMVFATPAKLKLTTALRVDTGDPLLDAQFSKKEYLPVVIGYRTMRMHPLQV